MLSTSKSTKKQESENQAVHLRTACEVLPMENQPSAPGDGNRSPKSQSTHLTDVAVNDSMQLNPYEPSQHILDRALGNSRFTFAHRVGFVGLLSALFAFAIGVVWIKVLRRNLTEVSPVSWTLAQSLAYGSMAILMIGVVSMFRTCVSRFSDRFANEEKTVFGWNLIPVIVSSLIGTVWFSVACLGLYWLIVELINYDFYSGIPVLEIVLQFLLYVSGIAAAQCSLRGIRQWMRMNFGRALIFTAFGFSGPLLAYLMLFAVCEDLVRKLV